MEKAFIRDNGVNTPGDVLGGHQQETLTERDWKLKAARTAEESPPAGRVKNEEAWSPDSPRSGQSGLLPDCRPTVS